MTTATVDAAFSSACRRRRRRSKENRKDERKMLIIQLGCNKEEIWSDNGSTGNCSATRTIARLKGIRITR